MRLSYALALLTCLVLASPVRGTWSIAAADTETQEVAVASATCVTGIDLRAELPTVRVGVGAGAAQSQLDSNGTRRDIMWDGLIAGRSSSAIMQQLAGLSGSRIHQNGLADTGGDAATFSGNGTFAHSSGVTGQVGTLHYAIQGNILTGRPVIDMAEAALRDPANGDLPGRVMAAMEAARAMGVFNDGFHDIYSVLSLFGVLGFGCLVPGGRFKVLDSRCLVPVGGIHGIC